MIHTDHIFKIGSTHKVCQDYALSGVTNGVHYAIVCDGCSGSDNTDVGARLIAHSAVKLIHIEGKDFLNSGPEAMGRHITSEIITAKGLFGLNTSAFDATLMCAVAWEDRGAVKARVVVFGDGVVARSSDGDIYANHWEFENQAPAYITNRYIYKVDLESQECVRTIWEGEECDIISQSAGRMYFGSVDMLPGDWLLLSTDGLGSFEKCDKGSILPWKDRLDALTEFKGLHGEFLQRRVRAYLKKCAGEGINHFDDFAVAGISITP